jgi:hypothetical protein
VWKWVKSRGYFGGEKGRVVVETVEKEYHFIILEDHLNIRIVLE